MERTHARTDGRTDRQSGRPIWPTDTPTRRHADTPTRRHADTPTHQPTLRPTHRRADRWIGAIDRRTDRPQRAGEASRACTSRKRSSDAELTNRRNLAVRCCLWSPVREFALARFNSVSTAGSTARVYSSAVRRFAFRPRVRSVAASTCGSILPSHFSVSTRHSPRTPAAAHTASVRGPGKAPPASSSAQSLVQEGSSAIIPVARQRFYPSNP